MSTLAALVAVALIGCQNPATPPPTAAPPPRATYTPTVSPTSTSLPTPTSTPLPLLRVGLDASDRPWCYATETGALAGIEVDLLTALAAEMQVRLELVNTAPHLLGSGLAAGRFDLAAVSGAVGGQDPAIILSRPFITVAQTLITGPTGVAPATLSALKGMTVGVQIGSVAASHVRAAGATPRLYDDLAIALAALERGEVSVVAGDRSRAADYLRSHPGTPLRLGAVAFAPRPVSLALAARSPLTARVNGALDALARRGYLTDLEQRWLN